LLGYCFDLLKAGRKANVQGRDVGKGLSALIKKSKVSDVSSFLQWLQNWRESECMRLAALNRSVDLVNDKAECLEAICEGCNSLEEVNSKIDILFSDGDDKTRIILSSTHKAKGLERRNVFLLRDTYKPGKTQEESNLLYVGITRTIENLYYVRGNR
jgi:superfamily I DNA/RNA helicase